MAIDPHFIPAFSIETVILDKDTGAPLSGGQVTFYEDAQRGTQKPVYQITGSSPAYTYTELPNPMTLSSIGTFEDSLGNPVVPYFYPYDDELKIQLYYVVVESFAAVPQFVREAVPYIPDNGGDITLQNIITNEISNPQFAEVLFDTQSAATYTYTFSAASEQVVNLAPDWDLIVTCPTSGSVTVAQLGPIGTQNLPTNPATLLNITSAGITKLLLRQRLFGSPNLWGNGWLSASFIAKTYSGTSAVLDLYYSQSAGTVIDQIIVSATLPSSGAYAAYPGSINLPISNNPQDFPGAYVDIFFDLPLSIEIDISSVIVSGTGGTPLDNIIYDQVPVARQIDQLFHYYELPLLYKPIPSMLVGWDFPLNPAQSLGTTVTMTTTPAYIWDQTISSSIVGNVAVVRNTVTGGFQATTANNAESFCQIQYLSGLEAKEILGKTMAVNINAYRTTAGGVCNVHVYLFSGRSAAVFPVLPLLIGSFDASGVFTKNNTAGQGLNWSLIPRVNLPDATGSLSTVDTANYSTLNNVIDLSFNGWELTDSTQIGDTDKFAIVVTYSCPTSGTAITVDSISLVPGDVATRPAPQTISDVLAECQYYYEKSYPTPVIPGTNTAEASLTKPQTWSISFNGGTGAVTSSVFTAASFDILFNTVKRSTPTVVIYSPAGVINSVEFLTYLNGAPVATGGTGIGAWSAVASTKVVNYLMTTDTTFGAITGGTVGINGTISASIQFHYVVDARLGVV